MATKPYPKTYGAEKMTPAMSRADRLSAAKMERRNEGYRRNVGVDPLRARRGYLATQWSLSLSGPTPERVHLSPLGRKIGHWHRVLQGIRDRHDREAALCGVAHLKQRLLAAGDQPLTARLIRVIEQGHAGGDRLQQETFAVIGYLSALGLSLDKWSETYLQAADTGLLSTFVSESADILHGESVAADVQETFALFLDIWKTEKIAGMPSKVAEKRKYYRKRLQIRGHFNPVHSTQRSDMIIRDICPGGIGFRAIGRDLPEENDLIRVFFLLDGYMKQYINKLALVRRFDGVYAGAQFC